MGAGREEEKAPSLRGHPEQGALLEALPQPTGNRQGTAAPGPELSHSGAAEQQIRRSRRP